MCGIAGFVNKSDSRLYEAVIRDMLKLLIPRGPDGTSWSMIDYENRVSFRNLEDNLSDQRPIKMAMGCSRLAIVDLSKNGLQPLKNEDGSILAVMNGEIFNFIELRDEFSRLGHQFKSKTDTEVIPHAFEEWGTDCFSHFNGQFAIAILDRNTDNLILGRDRLGVKPLFFHHNRDKISFASEIKAILKFPGYQKRINLNRLTSTIGLPYKLHAVSGESLFADISEVRPGEWIRFDREFTQNRQMYWDPSSLTTLGDITFSSAREKLRDLYVDAVRLRLRGDRKASFIISGGVDSSSVVGIARQECGVEPETFSLDIPDARFNENEAIREIIRFLNVKSNFVPVTGEKVKTVVPELIDTFDEPVPTPNGILHALMSDAISAKGYRVVLSGVGGDEVFYGYHDHFLYFLYYLEQHDLKRFKTELDCWQRGQKRPLSVYEKFKEFLSSDDVRFSPDFLARSQGFDYRNCLIRDLRDNHLKPQALYEGLDLDPRGKQILDMWRLTLPYSLKMDDRFYMSRGLETRHPLLDYRLVEFGLNLPVNLKIRCGISKFILRSAIKGFIPSDRRKDTKKIGLNLPIDKWMRGSLREWVQENLASKDNPVYNYADFNFVERVLADHFSGNGNHSLKLWDLINVNLWLKKHFSFV
jgi:asparagine synthase (glutamine-hydrolysing)